MELAEGMPVRVHFNLHVGGFSVTVGGRVVARVPAITLAGVEFRVQQGGLAAARRERRRRVCAYALGTIESLDPSPDVAGLRKVTFRPWGDADTFVYADDGGAVREAGRVVFVSENGHGHGYA